MRDDGYANVSYKVFNIGEANHLPAYSMELGVASRATATSRQSTGSSRSPRRGASTTTLVHTSPIALRFVAPSKAYASMMYEQPTMMIELILVVGTRGGDRLLAGYEEGLADLGVRPHWGQINALDGARVAQLYPRWGDWLAVQHRFNASGVFRSPFTDRVGVTPPATPPAGRPGPRA